MSGFACLVLVAGGFVLWLGMCWLGQRLQNEIDDKRLEQGKPLYWF